MTNENLRQPHAHEAEVARREADATGKRDDQTREDYDDEVVAERTGRTGEEVEEERREAADEKGVAARWETG